MQAERGSGTLGRRALLTLGVFALVYVGRQLPLPGIDIATLPRLSQLSLVSVLSLGLTPWIGGWLLIEVLSLFPWPLRRWRRGGWPGRQSLDRASMVAGLAIAFVQARGIASLLETWTGVGGAPMVSHPGWSFWLPCVLTLVAASSALFWLATVLTRWGIGNGFSLLLLFELLLQLWRETAGAELGSLSADRLDPTQAPLQGLAALILAFWLVAYLRLNERRRGERETLDPSEADDGSASEEDPPSAPMSWRPAFPQSLIAVPIAGGMLQLLFGRGTWSGLLGATRFGQMFAGWGVWGWIACQTLLVTLLAWLLFRLFSGPGRLAAELAIATEERERLGSELWRRFVPSTLLLLAGSAGLAAWSVFFPGPWATLLDIVRLGLLIAVPWDLASQWRFSRHHGEVATLCSLNNVHLAPRIVAHLEAAGIPATLQGFRHRALFFSYLPLVRIGVLVPVRSLDEARLRLAELDLAVV